MDILNEKGDKMNRKDLIKQAKKVCKIEKELNELEVKKQQVFADMWLNTNFEEALDKKRATEEDKKSFIRTNKEYMDVVGKIAQMKAMKNYENNILEIFLTVEE